MEVIGFSTIGLLLSALNLGVSGCRPQVDMYAVGKSVRPVKSRCGTWARKGFGFRV